MRKTMMLTGLQILYRMNIGWAMLAFQMFGLISAMLPRFIKLIIWFIKGIAKLIRGKTGADRFADVVKEAMMRNAAITGRKYADRWLVKVHKRGFHGRQLQRHEMGETVLPFKLESLR